MTNLRLLPGEWQGTAGHREREEQAGDSRPRRLKGVEDKIEGAGDDAKQRQVIPGANGVLEDSEQAETGCDRQRQGDTTKKEQVTIPAYQVLRRIHGWSLLRGIGVME